MRVDTSLVQVVRDPLHPWKTSLDVFRRARQMGMEVVVALDSRSEKGSREAVKEVARVIEFDSEDCWPEAQLNSVLDAANREWAFLVSDDEMPSDALWAFATKPPALLDKKGQHYLWRPRMLAPLPDWSAHYRPLDTYQPRYFPRESIRWPGGFDEMPKSPLEEIDFDLVLWHFTLWSPREHREQKVEQHEAAWMRSWAKHPWPFPGAASYLYEDHPDQYASLEEWKEQKPARQDHRALAAPLGHP